MRQGTSNMISTAGGVDSGAADADLSALRAQLEPLEPQQCLQWALDRYGAGFAMTTSFGIQSSVLLHMLSRLPGGDAVPVIWVDTGYLPPETYRYAQTLCERLGRALSWRSPACHRPEWKRCMVASGNQAWRRTWTFICDCARLSLWKSFGSGRGALLGQWCPSRPNRPAQNDDCVGSHPRPPVVAPPSWLDQSGCLLLHAEA